MSSEELEKSLRSEIDGYLHGRLNALQEEVSRLQSYINRAFSDLLEQSAQPADDNNAVSAALAEHLRASYAQGVEKATADAAEEAAHIAAQTAQAAADAAEKAARIAAETAQTAAAEAARAATEAAQSKPYQSLTLLSEAVADIDNQRSQGDILNALVNYAASFAARAVFFIVRQDHAQGWRGRGLAGTVGDEAARRISLSLADEHAVSVASRTQAASAGTPDDQPQNYLLINALGGDAPAHIAALPLVVRGKTVAVLYADSGITGEANLQIAALATLMRVAGMSVELLAVTRGAARPNALPALPVIIATTPAPLQAAAQPQVVAPSPAPVATSAPSAASAPLPAAETPHAAQPEPVQEVTPTPAPSAPEPTPVTQEVAASPAAQEPAESAPMAAPAIPTPVEQFAAPVPSAPEEAAAPPQVETTATAETTAHTDAPYYANYQPDAPQEAVPVAADDAPAPEAQATPPAFNVTTAQVETVPEVVETTPAPEPSAPVTTYSFESPAVPIFETTYTPPAPVTYAPPAPEPVPVQSSWQWPTVTTQMPTPPEPPPAPEPPSYQPIAQESYQPPAPPQSFATPVPPALPTFTPPAPETFTPPPAPQTPTPDTFAAPPSPFSRPTGPLGSARTYGREVDLPISVGDDERRLHNDARRFARLLVSEIKLYNEPKVREGRQAQDIYVRLRDAIDRSRQMYERRVAPPVATRFDYFHYELVNTLAEGDVNKLGADYPGSTVER